MTTASSPSELDAAPLPSEPVWRLHIVASLDPAMRGRVLPLHRGSWVLGRQPQREDGLTIDDARMSREHALLRVRDGYTAIDVQDLGSRNGIWQAGVRIDKTTLGQGAVLRIGGTVAVLESDAGRFAEFAEPCAELPGGSAVMRSVRAAVAAAARDDLPTLITGETGTGKEFAAAALHRLSRRRGRMVRFNIAAVPDNLFESELFGHARGAFTGANHAHAGRVREADGGTLVLDEIGELPSPLQAKLLRVLEERLVRPVGGERDVSVDVRFVGVTNADLSAAVREGRFRADLLGRLMMHQVRLTPVAGRRADLLTLCDTVLPMPAPPGTPARSWSERLAADAVEWLLLRPWYGNLRELKSVLLRLRDAATTQLLSKTAILDLLPDVDAWVAPRRPASTGDETPMSVDLADVSLGGVAPGCTAPYEANAAPLRPALPSAPPRRSPRTERPDADTLRTLLRHHHGSIEMVARELGRDRRQVYRWLEYADISPDEVDLFRDADGND